MMRKPGCMGQGIFDIAHKLYFLENEMVGRKDCDIRLRVALKDGDQGEKDAWSGFPAARLNDKGRGGLVAQIALHVRDMSLIDNCQNLVCRKKKADPVERMA